MSTCTPAEGWREGKGFRPHLWPSGSIGIAHEISLWCLRLGPLAGDVASVWHRGNCVVWQEVLVLAPGTELKQPDGQS